MDQSDQDPMNHHHVINRIMIIVIIIVAIQIVKNPTDTRNVILTEIDHEDVVHLVPDQFHHYIPQDQDQKLEKIKKEKTEKEKEAQAVTVIIIQIVQAVNQNHHEKEDD